MMCITDKKICTVNRNESHGANPFLIVDSRGYDFFLHHSKLTGLTLFFKRFYGVLTFFLEQEDGVNTFFGRTLTHENLLPPAFSEDLRKVYLLIGFRGS